MSWNPVSPTLHSEQPFRAQTISHNFSSLFCSFVCYGETCKSLAAHMIHNTEKLLYLGALMTLNKDESTENSRVPKESQFYIYSEKTTF